LQPEILFERCGIYEAQSRAQAEEPAAAKLLADHRAAIEQSERRAGLQRRIGSQRSGLDLDVVEHALGQRTDEKISKRPHPEPRQLSAVVVETDGRLSGHQVTEQFAL